MTQAVERGESGEGQFSPEKTGARAGIRDAKGRFKPGFSGNPGGIQGDGPGGRPANKARELAREHGAGCWEMLGRIISDPKEKSRDKVEAAKLLLGYGYGQPRQSLELSTPESAARVAALEAALAARLGLVETPRLPPGDGDDGAEGC